MFSVAGARWMIIAEGAVAARPGAPNHKTLRHAVAGLHDLFNWSCKSTVGETQDVLQRRKHVLGVRSASGNEERVSPESHAR